MNEKGFENGRRQQARTRLAAADAPLPSEEGTPGKVSRTFAGKQRPESGFDCLVCSMFAQKRAVTTPGGAGRVQGTSLTRKRTPLGPYCRPMPRVLGGS